ncbi:hypothetical protein N0V93_002030 [Gnomoniopsis smithogilvyi]|uniref:Heterokaryon incompatibility domain-containing protein n=1 Tax=Gnomoniopsis smithogilvyi TaxID=1191159 RepID=A0A9W8Z527_9PEZI|nr:hypothetical protein N0V93_002030 [Gnomoniopsis smithogilvyi]
MSSARDTDTSGSEVTEERLPGSNLISEWSPADVEELIQATKLCDECQSLLAPTHVTEACPKCTLKSEYAECFYYSHRKDHRDLVDSVHGGCHLCKKVLEWWLLMNGSKAIEDLEVDHVTLSYTNDGSGSLCVEGNTRENLYQSKTLILSAFANAQFFAIPLHQQRNELSIVRHWATVCQGSDHEACGRYRRQSRSKPKRLLQLDPRLPDLVKLIITDSSRAYVYATLSHRWGVKPLPGPLKLSSQRTTDDDGWVSVEELQAGISESSLPQTFRDALKIARHCELQYVWIDSLCIIQDEDSDGSNPDWNEEAAKMGNIYAGGLLGLTKTYSATSQLWMPSTLVMVCSQDGVALEY